MESSLPFPASKDSTTKGVLESADPTPQEPGFGQEGGPRSARRTWVIGMLKMQGLQTMKTDEKYMRKYTQFVSW